MSTPRYSIGQRVRIKNIGMPDYPDITWKHGVVHSYDPGNIYSYIVKWNKRSYKQHNFHERELEAMSVFDAI